MQIRIFYKYRDQFLVYWNILYEHNFTLDSKWNNLDPAQNEYFTIIFFYKYIDNSVSPFPLFINSCSLFKIHWSHCNFLIIFDVSKILNLIKENKNREILNTNLKSLGISARDPSISAWVLT